MKHLCKITVTLTILAASCKNKDHAEAHSVEKKNNVTLTQNPHHRDVEFFISQGTPETKQGARIRPNLDALESNVIKQYWTQSYTPANTPANKYDMKVTYLGSSPASDKYEINLTYPTDQGRKKAVFMVDYEGRTIIVHTDPRKNGYVIGIQPIN
jgi:hypothetical protein